MGQESAEKRAKPHQKGAANAMYYTLLGEAVIEGADAVGGTTV